MRTENIRWLIITEILGNDLKPYVGFSIIARHIPAFLPALRALTIDPVPKVQLLFHKAPDEYLTIVASTGSEPLNTRVLRDRSVCGRLLTGNLDLINLDPRTDPLYRSYLGSDMKSEMALRLKIDSSVSAIINLETEKENAFGEIQTSTLLLACQQLTPILKGLYFRRDRTLMQQRAILYSLDHHLGVLAANILHNLVTPLAAASGLMDVIEQDCGITMCQDGPSLKLREMIENLRVGLTTFATDIVGFSHNEERSVRNLIEEAIALRKPKKLRERNIEIKLEPGEDYKIYCSLLLKEVFFNIIDNAVYWIDQKQQEKRTHHGEIIISTSKEPGPRPEDRQEQELNKKIRVVIRDNGPGLVSKHKDQIFEQGFTMRREGTGYGLFAAREYVASIGGEINFSSEEGRFFEVVIILEEYDTRLHVEPDATAVFSASGEVD